MVTEPRSDWPEVRERVKLLMAMCDSGKARIEPTEPDDGVGVAWIRAMDAASIAADRLSAALAAKEAAERELDSLIEIHYGCADRISELERENANLREHALASNPKLRQLHDHAVAYVDAVNALNEVRGGNAPLSTTLGFLIRQGYLVPSEKVDE